MEFVCGTHQINWVILLRVLILCVFLISCASTRPWTREEKVLLGASCLATVADTVTTIDMLNNGNWEINPMMGKHPSYTQVVVTMSITQVLTIVAAHYWDDFRSWILGAKTGINVGFAFHNLRLKENEH